MGRFWKRSVSTVHRRGFLTTDARIRAGKVGWLVSRHRRHRGQRLGDRFGLRNFNLWRRGELLGCRGVQLCRRRCRWRAFRGFAKSGVDIGARRLLIGDAIGILQNRLRRGFQTRLNEIGGVLDDGGVDPRPRGLSFAPVSIRSILSGSAGTL